MKVSLFFGNSGRNTDRRRIKSTFCSSFLFFVIWFCFWSICDVPISWWQKTIKNFHLFLFFFFFFVSQIDFSCQFFLFFILQYQLMSISVDYRSAVIIEVVIISDLGYQTVISNPKYQFVYLLMPKFFFTQTFLSNISSLFFRRAFRISDCWTKMFETVYAK